MDLPGRLEDLAFVHKDPGSARWSEMERKTDGFLEDSRTQKEFIRQRLEQGGGSCLLGRESSPYEGLEHKTVRVPGGTWPS